MGRETKSKKKTKCQRIPLAASRYVAAGSGMRQDFDFNSCGSLIWQAPDPERSEEEFLEGGALVEVYFEKADDVL